MTLAVPLVLMGYKFLMSHYSRNGGGTTARMVGMLSKLNFRKSQDV